MIVYLFCVCMWGFVFGLGTFWIIVIKIPDFKLVFICVRESRLSVFKGASPNKNHCSLMYTPFIQSLIAFSWSNYTTHHLQFLFIFSVLFLAYSKNLWFDVCWSIAIILLKLLTSYRQEEKSNQCQCYSFFFHISNYHSEELNWMSIWWKLKNIFFLLIFPFRFFSSNRLVCSLSKNKN